MKLAYNVLLADIQTYQNKINWALMLKHILETTGFSHVWLNQGIANVNIINKVMAILKQRILDCYSQER